MDSSGSGQRQMADCFEYSDALSGSIKCGEYIESLRNC